MPHDEIIELEFCPLCVILNAAKTEQLSFELCIFLGVTIGHYIANHPIQECVCTEHKEDCVRFDNKLLSIIRKQQMKIVK